MRQLNLIEVTNARNANRVTKQVRTVAGDLASLPVLPANLSPWQPMLPRHESEPQPGMHSLEASALRAGRLAAVSGSFAGDGFGSFAYCVATKHPSPEVMSARSASKRSVREISTAVIHLTNRYRLTVDHDYRSHDHRDAINSTGRRDNLPARRTTATLTVGK